MEMIHKARKFEMIRVLPKLAHQIDELRGQIRRLVEQNAHSSMSEEKYKAEQAKLDNAYEKLVARKKAIEKEQADRQRGSSEIGLFLQKVEGMEECLEFDPGVFSVLVDRVVVSGRKKDVGLRFVSKGGRCTWTARLESLSLKPSYDPVLLKYILHIA